MRGQEGNDLPADLQVRHVGIEIDPIEALQIQGYLPIEHVIHSHRFTHAPQPDRSQAVQPTQTSPVRGGASLGDNYQPGEERKAMGKVLLEMSMSLDGHVVGPDVSPNARLRPRPARRSSRW